MNILVFDDDIVRHEWFRKMLQGHSVKHASNAVEAFRLLGENVFDVAYLDHDMDLACDHAEFDGTAVAQALIDMPENQRPHKVIIHSWNSVGSLRMAEMLANTGFYVERQPFPPAWIPGASGSLMYLACQPPSREKT
jgi:CheY-like chemotaxis protein